MFQECMKRSIMHVWHSRHQLYKKLMLRRQHFIMIKMAFKDQKQVGKMLNLLEVKVEEAVRLIQKRNLNKIQHQNRKKVTSNLTKHLQSTTSSSKKRQMKFQLPMTTLQDKQFY